MSDATLPPSPRVDAVRRSSVTDAQARVLVRRLTEASGQVDAMLEQLGDIVALLRGEDRAASRPVAPGPPGLRRTTQSTVPRHDGDRRA